MAADGDPGRAAGAQSLQRGCAAEAHGREAAGEAARRRPPRVGVRAWGLCGDKATQRWDAGALGAVGDPACTAATGSDLRPLRPLRESRRLMAISRAEGLRGQLRGTATLWGLQGDDLNSVFKN